MNARTAVVPACLLLWSLSQFAVADVYRCADPKTKALADGPDVFAMLSAPGLRAKAAANRTQP